MAEPAPSDNKLALYSSFGVACREEAEEDAPTLFRFRWLLELAPVPVVFPEMPEETFAFIPLSVAFSIFCRLVGRPEDPWWPGPCGLLLPSPAAAPNDDELLEIPATAAVFFPLAGMDFKFGLLPRP